MALPRMQPSYCVCSVISIPHLGTIHFANQSVDELANGRSEPLRAVLLSPRLRFPGDAETGRMFMRGLTPEVCSSGVFCDCSP